jgi:hypothetical protein
MITKQLRPFLYACAATALIQTCSAQVTIEIVNDSGKSDGAVFIKTPGTTWGLGPTFIPVTPTNLFVDFTSTNTSAADATSLPLTFLATNYSVAPYTIVSPITGRTNTVYSFQADYLQSGSIYFTYDKPYTFTNGLQPSAPPDSFGNAYRYDYSELSINDQAPGNNAVDVTYVDKFGIPIQAEWYAGTSPNSPLIAGSYVYLSTKTMVDRFDENGLSQAVFSLGTNNISAGWTYGGPNSYTNFARILAPQKISGTGTSVYPYPTITNYLNSLVGPAHSFWLNGASAQGSNNYEGYVVTVTNVPSGWLVSMVKGPTTPPYNTNVVVGIPYTNTVSFVIPSASADQYVYGSPVGPGLYYTNGVLVTNTTPTAAVEKWMIGDVLSSINFGFWAGNYGTNSADWFSAVKWTSLPFASARPTDDGYFNLYAGLIYDYSDPYSYAFSERITPDVLMTPVNNQKVRLTILPDDRLDSAIVLTPSTNDITSSSIKLSWLPSSGAQSYKLNVLRPLNIPPVTVPAGTTNYTFTNLLSGSPYVFSVQAMGTGAGGNPILAPGRPVSSATTGNTTTNAGNFALIQTTFNAADAFYQLSKVYINGFMLIYTNNAWLTPDILNATWMASTGTNQVIVTVVDTNNQVIFNDWFTFTLAPGWNESGNTHSAVSNVFFFGQKLSAAPTVVNIYSGTATNFVVSTTPPPCISFGLSYVPAETRKYKPMKSVNPPASGVVITNVAGLPGGGIRFSFNIGAGTNYAVLATTNVASGPWVTNATGIGQPGGVSYTNAAGTNTAQFYRIKY